MLIEWIELTAFPLTGSGITLYKGKSMLKARWIKFLNLRRYKDRMIICGCWECGPHVTPEYIKREHPSLYTTPE